MITFLQAIIAFLFGTVIFDIVHYCLHRFLKSNNKSLRKIGRWHTTHHRFFPATLNVTRDAVNDNLLRHVIFEYVVQTLGTLACLFFFNPVAIWLAISFSTCIFIAVYFYWRGADPHHQSLNNVPAYRGGLFVCAAYHALHHMNPNYFYSGYIKLIDYLLGTSLPLIGKHIALTGASGALGSNMKALLEKEGAIITTLKFGVDYDYEDYTKLIPTLEKTDILFLCHGSKYDYAQAANCDSFVSMIELFKSVRKRGLAPLEVWAVGSEIECHPCFGIKKLKVYAQSKRNYAKHARKYFHDKEFLYRHIVHSAFTSRMGPGLMSARFAAMATLFFLKRGFKYVPVSYTGFAWANYFRFMFSKANLPPYSKQN